jgi:hypothetical protein
MKIKNAILLILFCFNPVFFSNANPVTSLVDSKSELIVITDEVQSCYDVGVTNGIQNCMISLSERKRNQYNNSYNEFMKISKSEKTLIINKSDFISDTEKAKKFYDEYINYECKVISDLSIKGTAGYDIIFNNCLITLYDKRIHFYKNYRYD